VTLLDEYSNSYNQPVLDTDVNGTKDLNVTGASFVGGWTTINFVREQKTGMLFGASL